MPELQDMLTMCDPRAYVTLAASRSQQPQDEMPVGLLGLHPIESDDPAAQLIRRV
jgi:hypothetical protein